MRQLTINECQKIAGANFGEGISLMKLMNDLGGIRGYTLCASVACGFYGAKCAFASYGFIAGFTGCIGGLIGGAFLAPGALMFINELVGVSMEYYGYETEESF